MELLPLDIKRIIVDILSMPDKRNYIRCTKELNKIKIKQYEDEFIKMIHETYYLVYNIMWPRITKIEQYTLEMIYYGYEELIPERYICIIIHFCCKYIFPVSILHIHNISFLAYIVLFSLFLSVFYKNYIINNMYLVSFL